MKPLLSAPEIFKALAHPARVHIVRLLSDGSEKCVCDLVSTCGLGWSSMSRHLSVLREAGVISFKKRGVQIFYRLELACVVWIIDCLDHPKEYPEMHQLDNCDCR